MYVCIVTVTHIHYNVYYYVQLVMLYLLFMHIQCHEVVPVCN